MKYFEVVIPYYALLKAEDKEQALIEYNASVAYLEDINDIHEVQEDYALVRFSQVPSEDKKLLAPKTVLEEFNEANRCVLVWDLALA